jgi:hypothetical protein
VNWVRLSFVSPATMALTMALAIALTPCLGASPAQAQFVCGGSTDGNEPEGPAGAMAGIGVGSVACGTNANATSAATLGANGARHQRQCQRHQYRGRFQLQCRDRVWGEC